MTLKPSDQGRSGCRRALFIAMTPLVPLCLLLALFVVGRALPPRYHDVALAAAIQKIEHLAPAPLDLSPVDGMAEATSFEGNTVTGVRLVISENELADMVDAFSMEEWSDPSFARSWVQMELKAWARWGSDWFREWEQNDPGLYGVVEDKGFSLNFVGMKESGGAITLFVNIVENESLASGTSLIYVKDPELLAD